MAVQSECGMYFIDGAFKATPYQHHLNKVTWLVVLSTQRKGDFLTGRVSVVAEEPIEAALRAIETWRKRLMEEEEVEKVLAKRLLEKRVKRAEKREIAQEASKIAQDEAEGFQGSGHRAPRDNATEGLVEG